MPFTPFNRAARGADDEVADLPENEYFSGRLKSDRVADAAALFYKDGTGSVRQVRVGADGRFSFAGLAEGSSFASVGEPLQVPEVDPRAGTAPRAGSASTPAEIAGLAAENVFTALTAGADPSSHPFGVYRLGRDGMFRRLLKDKARGLAWSAAIRADAFAHFGERLTLVP